MAQLLYLKYDGDLVDSSPNAFVPTVSNPALTYVAGQVNQAVSQIETLTSGANYGLNATLDLSGTNPYTMQGWFRTSQTAAIPNGSMMIFGSFQNAGNFDGVGVAMTMGGVAGDRGKFNFTRRAAANNIVLQSPALYNDGNWYYFKCILNNTLMAMQMYIGTSPTTLSLVASTTFTVGIGTGKRSGVLGNPSTGALISADCWVGNVDEFEIFDTIVPPSVSSSSNLLSFC